MDARAYRYYDSAAVSDESALHCKDPTRTQESDAMDTDINVIVARFGITGQLPARDSLPLITNGDFQEALDFRQVQDLQIAAAKSFMELPANVRARFENDPVQFVEFCSRDDEDSAKEMVRLGIAVPKEVVKKLEESRDNPKPPVEAGK